MHKVIFVDMALLAIVFFNTIIDNGDATAKRTQHKFVKNKTDHLADCIDRGDVLEAEQAILAGADVNMQFENGETPLHKAVRTNSSTMTQLLLEHRADPTIANKNNETASGMAIRLNKYKVIDVLRNRN